MAIRAARLVGGPHLAARLRRRAAEGCPLPHVLDRRVAAVEVAPEDDLVHLGLVGAHPSVGEHPPLRHVRALLRVTVAERHEAMRVRKLRPVDQRSRVRRAVEVVPKHDVVNLRVLRAEGLAYGSVRLLKPALLCWIVPSGGGRGRQSRAGEAWHRHPIDCTRGPALRPNKGVRAVSAADEELGPVGRWGQLAASLRRSPMAWHGFLSMHTEDLDRRLRP